MKVPPVSLLGQAASIAVDVFMLVLLVIGALAVLRVAWLAVRFRWRRQLVVQALANLTGYPKIDADAAGLTQDIRDGLVAQFRAVHERARFLLGRDSIATGVAALTPPTGEIDTSLRALADSVTAVASDRVRPVAQLLLDLLRPSGTRIRGSLLRYGERDKLGVGFEIIDLRGDQPATTCSLWSGAGSLTEEHVKEDEATALAKVATRTLAIELLRLDLLRRQRRPAWRGARNPAAVISRFVGLVYQASAPTFPAYEAQLYSLAIGSLQDSATRLPDYYPAWKDLADTYIRRRKADPARWPRDLAAALTAYDHADKAIDRAQAKGTAKVTASLSVGVSRALARFHARTEIDLAREEARRLLGMVATGDRRKPTWDYAGERNEHLLYNAACLLALELAEPVDDQTDPRQLSTWAVQLLGHALLRDRSPDHNVFTTAEKDSDLDALRAHGIDTAQLSRRLRAAQRDFPCADITIVHDTVATLVRPFLHAGAPGTVTTDGL